MSRFLPLLFALFCALSLAKSTPLQVEYQQWENDYNCCDENVHNDIITTVIDKIAVRFHGTLKLKICTQAYQDRPDQGNMQSLNPEDEADGFPCMYAHSEIHSLSSCTHSADMEFIRTSPAWSKEPPWGTLATAWATACGPGAKWF